MHAGTFGVGIKRVRNAVDDIEKGIEIPKKNQGHTRDSYLGASGVGPGWAWVICGFV